MSPDNDRRRFGRRTRVAAVCAPALVAALLLAAHFREAQSQQTRPDLAADALPHLNRLAEHALRAAEFAKQIKARYPPTSAEYLDARRRYEAAAEKFDALLDTLSQSVGDGPDARSSAHLMQKARLAVEACDSFADWADDALQLLSRERGGLGHGAPPKAAEVVDVAGRITDSYGHRDGHAKGRVIELMKELARFKPWDEIPPFAAQGDAESTTPLASPSTTPMPSSSPAPPPSSGQDTPQP